MNKLFSKILDWYFTKKALPYWVVLLLDSLICYVSGLFVYWLLSDSSFILGHTIGISETIIAYMVFNLIGFRIFHTYSGVVRYSSFVDLRRIGYAMALSCVIAEVMHYPLYYLFLGVRHANHSTQGGFVRMQSRRYYRWLFV